MTDRRGRRLRRAAGHLCPGCKQLWALTAVRNDAGFLVICRHCDYRRLVSVPEQRAARPADDRLTGEPAELEVALVRRAATAR
ncbi:MAG TPA: hypothetical protein VLW53_15320 [Candidatus Eisenbacteria bacterium]|nr:hypothetical protein [Candidatus Eisenbacteria bacterium]